MRMLNLFLRKTLQLKQVAKKVIFTLARCTSKTFYKILKTLNNLMKVLAKVWKVYQKNY